MIYLSENTLEKYKQGYRKASTILADYINKSRPVSEVLAEKNRNDPQPEMVEKPTYYRLKHINRDIRKGLIFSVNRAKKDFSLIGYITLFGKEYESILGHLYQDTNGNRYAIPLPDKREFFM